MSRLLHLQIFDVQKTCLELSDVMMEPPIPKMFRTTRDNKGNCWSSDMFDTTRGSDGSSCYIDTFGTLICN